MLKPLTVWITTNCGKFWEMGIPDCLTCFLRSLYAVKKQQLEPDMEQWTGSKLGKEYVKAIYCHPAYLTSMQNARLDEPATNWKYQQPQIWASLVSQMVKNLPAMQETQFWSQCQVEKIPWRREWQPTPVVLPGEFHGQRSLAGYSQSMGSQRVRHNWTTNSFFHFQICRCYHSNSRKWRGTKEELTFYLLIKVKKESDKVFKTQHWKNKDHGLRSHYFTANTRRKQWQIFFSWAPKSLQMMTAVVKLKDACLLLSIKLWQT